MILKKILIVNKFIFKIFNKQYFNYNTKNQNMFYYYGNNDLPNIKQSNVLKSHEVQSDLNRDPFLPVPRFLKSHEIWSYELMLENKPSV